MAEWSFALDGDPRESLLESFQMGPIIDDEGRRYLTEERIGSINGLRIEIFANEHPPPHFRVWYNGESNNFTIKDCSPMNGAGLQKYFRNIKQWHKENRDLIIKEWNSRRPSDCPVGKFSE